MDAAFKPQVTSELDTRNFQKFEEVFFLYLLIFIVGSIKFSLLILLGFSFCTLGGPAYSNANRLWAFAKGSLCIIESL